MDEPRFLWDRLALERRESRNPDRHRSGKREVEHKYILKVLKRRKESAVLLRGFSHSLTC